MSPSTDQTGSCGSSEAELNRHKEEQLQVQNLFQTISSLKMDICTAVSQNVRHTALVMECVILLHLLSDCLMTLCAAVRAGLLSGWSSWRPVFSPLTLSVSRG